MIAELFMTVGFWVLGVIFGGILALYIGVFSTPSTADKDYGRVLGGFIAGCCVSGIINCFSSGFTFSVFLWGAIPVFLLLGVLAG